MRTEPQRDIGELLADTSLVTDALRQAAREALLRHQQAGLPVAIWRDGRVQWVAPEELDPSLAGSDVDASGAEPVDQVT
ncbi:MAG: hypothetical protein ACRDI2_21980 [Chloroflexota bacterium]